MRRGCRAPGDSTSQGHEYGLCGVVGHESPRDGAAPAGGYRVSVPAQPSFDLTDRVCVVTGGGRGIGAAISHMLAASGADVIVTGPSLDTLQPTVDEIVGAGGRAHALAADVSREEQVEELAAQVKARFGVPHVLVNNAGVNGIFKPLETTTLDEWNEIIGVNLTGAFLTMRAFGSMMVSERRGSIINISSVAGHVGQPRTGAYCASKGGVELLTRSVAIDWAKKGVRVNTVAPGYVETDMTRSLRSIPVIANHLKVRTPMGRFAQPDEITGAVLFLASDASAYVTGQSIRVDGGWSAA